MGNRPLPLSILIGFAISASTFVVSLEAMGRGQGSTGTAELCYHNPKAAGCPGASSTTQRTSTSSAAVQCKFDISVLSFVGEKFVGDTYCISASSDNEAAGKCKPGYTFVNPGNPDYLPAQRGAWGGRDTNNLGFYYCHKGSRKKLMCEKVASTAEGKKLKMQWSNVGSYGDGTCRCDKDPNSPGLENCNQPDLPQVADNCEAPNMKSDGKNGCQCEDGYEWKSGQGCKKIATNDPPPTQQVAANDLELTQAMRDCVDEHKKKADQCVTDASEAKKTCDADNKENEYSREAADFVSGMSGMYTQAKVGSGMQAECFKAGVLSNGTKIAMDKLNASCTDNFGKCEQSCSNEVEKSYRQKCGDIYKAQVLQKPGEESVGDGVGVVSKDQDYFLQNLPLITGRIEEGNKICQSEAKPRKSDLSKLIGGLGDALAKGAQCACQVAAGVLKTSAEGCQSVPTAAECAANPSLSGCGAYAVMDVCTMGSPAYNAQMCKCQFDPKSAGCGSSAAALNNAFAGAVPSSDGGANNGFTGFGAPAGSGYDGGNIDLNSGASGSGNNAKSGSQFGPGFTAGSGASGGLGAASSSGGGNGAASQAAGEGDGEHGEKPTLWNQAKSTLNNLFGRPNNANKAANNNGKGVGNKPFDKDKLKPSIRGLANDGSEFGSRNKDIWLVIKNRYQEDQIATP